MDRVSSESSRVERWQLKPGDHIFAWRRSGYEPYCHHGIYESDEKVMQLASARVATCHGCREASRRRGGGGGGVVVCCLDCFLGGDALCLFAYSVYQWFYDQRNSSHHPQLTCSTWSESPTETVLRRANDKLVHGFGACYDHATNNCYYFAFYCKTGRYLTAPTRMPCHRCMASIRARGESPPPPPWRGGGVSSSSSRRLLRGPMARDGDEDGDEDEDEDELPPPPPWRNRLLEFPQTNLGLRPSLPDPTPMTAGVLIQMWPQHSYSNSSSSSSASSSYRRSRYHR